PVVCRPGIVLVGRADKRQMLGARDVIYGTAVKMTIRVSLFVQREGVFFAQHQFDHTPVFSLGPVAIHDAVWLRQPGRFLNPDFQWSCHSALPASTTFGRGLSSERRWGCLRHN